MRGRGDFLPPIRWHDVVRNLADLSCWAIRPAGNWAPTEFSYDDVFFSAADGTRLHGWYFPHPQAELCVLYCHGNGEDVAALGPDMMRSASGTRSPSSPSIIAATAACRKT